MKTIFLVDGNQILFNKMIDIVEDERPLIIDAKNCDPIYEYEYLSCMIDEFIKSNKHIMLCMFSGKESIIGELGDEYAEMIIGISSNKNNLYYIEFPETTFSEFFEKLKKETYVYN